MSLKIIDVLEFLITCGPGRTQKELARAIFGAEGYSQRVRAECDRLVRSGRVERRGRGGSASPFTYYPPASGA